LGYRAEPDPVRGADDVSALEDALETRIREIVRAELDAVQERRRWCDIAGVAGYLGMPVSRVRHLRERGMPAKRIGKRLLFDLHAVDEWLERQP
jgi:excisionase family DNA binding protein